MPIKQTAMVLDRLRQLEACVLHRCFRAAADDGDLGALITMLDGFVETALPEPSGSCQSDDDCPPGHYCDLELGICLPVPETTFEARSLAGGS